MRQREGNGSVFFTVALLINQLMWSLVSSENGLESLNCFESIDTVSTLINRSVPIKGGLPFPGKLPDPLLKFSEAMLWGQYRDGIPPNRFFA